MNRLKAKRKTNVVVILFFLLIAGKANAQFYKDMSVGLNVGAYVYQGDLTPDQLGSLKTIKAGLSVFAKKPINNFLSVRLQMSFASLKGDESKYSTPSWRQQRNFKFTTPVSEFSLQLVWDILGRNYDHHGIMPYVFSGAGVSFVNIKKDYSQMNAVFFSESSAVVQGLKQDSIAGLPRQLLSVPVGIGADYAISEKFLLNIEMSYRFVFTDYLDGFSKSVNPKNQDHYYSTSVGLVYKFGKASNNGGVGCPRMKN